jgi:hypothetical protein
MKKLTLAILVTVIGTATGSTFAQSSPLKPGLWEMKTIRQVMDGRDMSAQMNAAQGQMEEAMAQMSPDQRKKMEAMMGGQGMPTKSKAGGGMRICMSAAMAARDKPMVDPEGHCEPSKLSRSGNKSTFEFNCTSNGQTTVGKGESTVSGDTVATRVDMTMTDAKGRHTMQNETQMKYLGPDCQGIKPMDQMGKDAKK